MAYVCIGHVTRDVSPHGWTFGGTTLFATLAAAHLGWPVTAVTCLRAADAAQLRRLHPHIDWRVRPARTTTTFRNVYRRGRRTQSRPSRAPPIAAAEVRSPARGARVVHLGPIAREVGPALVRCLEPGPLVGLTGQGLVRAVGASGAVQWRAWRPRRAFLDRCDVVILSDEDIAADPVAGRSYLRDARVGVLTRGAKSIEIYSDGQTHELPVHRVAEHNPTGTGDVFAAALLIQLAESGELGRAVAFAAAAAACWIGRPGHPRFPGRAAVEARMRRPK